MLLHKTQVLLYVRLLIFKDFLSCNLKKEKFNGYHIIVELEIIFLVVVLFYLYIYLPGSDSQKSNGGAVT